MSRFTLFLKLVSHVKIVCTNVLIFRLNQLFMNTFINSIKARKGKFTADFCSMSQTSFVEEFNAYLGLATKCTNRTLRNRLTLIHLQINYM